MSLLLSWAVALPATTYCDSDILMGQAIFCKGHSDAKKFPVRQQDGDYWDCDLFMGGIGHCHHNSHRIRFPVRQSDGLYRDCDIISGRVSLCHEESIIVKTFPVLRAEIEERRNE